MKPSVVLVSIAAAGAGIFLLLRSALVEPPPLPERVAQDEVASLPPTPTHPTATEALAPSSPAPDAADAQVPSIDPDRLALARPNGPDAGGMADRIDYPLSPKLGDRSLSDVPHSVVGAWDDTPDSPDLGPRRAFILVVAPDLSDADLADLARDVRDSHLDAEWLTLRIFDNTAAATRPSWTDGGASRNTHLVAELRRNTSGPGETLEIRGQPVDL